MNVELLAHPKRVVWSFDQSPTIHCLICLLSYEGSISNAFHVWRNIVTGRAVILVFWQRKTLCSGGSGCTLRTICSLSTLNKEKGANAFESFSVSRCYSFPLFRNIKTTLNPLNNFWIFKLHILMNLSFWWYLASDELASDDVITSGALCLQEHFWLQEQFFFRRF